MGVTFLARIQKISAGYVVALAGLCAAALLTVLLVHFHLPRPLPGYAFLLVIIACAWRGYGPGIFACLATLLLAPYLVMPTYSIRHPNLANAPQILLISVLISWMASARSKLNEANELLDERVRQRTAELERANAALQDHEARLIRQAEELARSNADLEQFAYIASHDLQEPLRTIAIYTELLRQRWGAKLDAESLDFMQTVLDGVRRMESLVRDLLTYSRAIHSETVETREIDSGEALRVALANLQAQIQSSAALIEFNGLPRIAGDRAQLTQIFQNLVSNALKYRGDASPRVVVEANQRDGRWVFSVADNGIGIHADYHEMIFCPFKRLHGQEYPGSGVGLAICRRIVDRLGGRIWVESEPECGSTFYFTMPVSSAKPLVSGASNT